MADLWVDGAKNPWRYNGLTRRYQRLAADGQWINDVPAGPLRRADVVTTRPPGEIVATAITGQSTVYFVEGPPGPPGPGSPFEILTQEAYDALGSAEKADTLYVIRDDAG